MVAVVVVAHAPLASALAAAVGHVYSRTANSPAQSLTAVDIAADTSPDAAVAEIQAAISTLPDKHEILILTDLAGATPANVASCLQAAGHVAVLAGVSLPMTLKALCYRHLSLDQVVQKAMDGGLTGVTLLTAPQGRLPEQLPSHACCQDRPAS